MKHIKNVAGRYYVDCENCLTHHYCVQEAPNNFATDEEHGFAYVYKQPETEEEEAQCQTAMEFCPMLVIHDDGDVAA